MSRPGHRRSRLWAWVVLLALPAGCGSCPPAWADSLQVRDGDTLAAGSAGEVFVDADATSLALTRAARRLADHLALDVERRLSVLLIDGRLFVEAVGEGGVSDALDGLELVELRRCGSRTHALLRLPRR